MSPCLRGSSSLLLLLLLTTSLTAQDQVTVSTGADNQVRRTLSGNITDYTGKELKITLVTGQTTTVPAARIISVVPARHPPHVEADTLASQHKFAEAIEAYRRATAAEERVWLKRRIMADVVTCYESLGQWDRAGEAFVLVMKSDEHWQYFERIPLNWGSGLVEPALAERAKTWLASENLPPVQLLGASYALAGEDRATALAVLRALSGASDPRLAHLADAQVWRSNIATVGPQELKAWDDQIARMPANLRSGPYLVLGRGWMQQDSRMLGPAEGIYRRAVWAFLKPPVLSPARPAHAVQGLVSAADPLTKLQWNDEAAIVLREAAQNYAATEAGQAAAQQLKQSPATPP